MQRKYGFLRVSSLSFSNGLRRPPIIQSRVSSKGRKCEVRSKAGTVPDFPFRSRNNFKGFSGVV